MAARSSSGRRPRPARSTRPRCTWRPATSTGSSPASTTSVPATSRSGRSGAATSARRWPRRPPTRRLARRAGGHRAVGDLLAQHLEVPGARVSATSSGTPARCWRTSWPSATRWGRRRGSSPASSTTPSNRLLGLDPEREAALELVAVGPEGAAAPSAGALPLDRSRDHAALVRAGRLSRAARDGRGLAARDAPRRCGGGGSGARRSARGSRPARCVPLPPPRREAGRDLGETIQRRGSTRRVLPRADQRARAVDRAVGGDASGPGRRSARPRRSLPRAQRGGRAAVRRRALLAGAARARGALRGRAAAAVRATSVSSRRWAATPPRSSSSCRRSTRCSRPTASAAIGS